MSSTAQLCIPLGQGIDGLSKGAEFSDCRLFRYALWRNFEPDAPTVTFVGLNPSKADEVVDDRTIRRCIDFAKRWGYGRLVMLNAYGFQATKPADMKKAPDPNGPGNDEAIRRYSQASDMIVVAWGVNCSASRQEAVCKLIEKPLYCLGKTQGGFPRHPLYLAKNTPLERFEL